MPFSLGARDFLQISRERERACVSVAFTQCALGARFRFSRLAGFVAAAAAAAAAADEISIRLGSIS